MLCLPVLIKNTEEKLIALRREMTNAGYASSEWPPHITLAAYEDLDAEALCDWTGEFVREHTRQADVRLCEPSAAVCHAPRNRRAVPEPGARKTFCRFFTMRSTKKYESFCKGIGSFSAVSEDKPVIHCTLSVVRGYGVAGRARARLPKMISLHLPKLPRWRSTPIPCASSNGLT